METQKRIDLIELDAMGMVQLREVTETIENGEVVKKLFHRWSLIPGQDISGESLEVQKFCNDNWTEDVVQNFKQLTSQVKG